MTDTAPSGSYSWWATEGEGRTVVEAAKARIAYTFATFDHVYVSFSGGKDSTVVLNLTIEVARELGLLPVRVVFFDEECISRFTEDYVRRVCAEPEVAVEWYCLPVRHRNGCSDTEPFWWPWAPEDRDKWVRPLPPEAVTHLDGFPIEPRENRLSIPDTCPLFVKDNMNTAVLMGIRANESMTRRKAISGRRQDNFVIHTHPGFSKSYPIYDWRTQDVWTAPAQFGWDYNRSYDMMEMVGIPQHRQRVAPPWGEDSVQDLWMWAPCFPEVWDKMCERVPGVMTAYRYARTELYSFQTVTEKPPGITWQQHVHNRILQIESEDPTLARYVAYKVRQTIRRHFSKTTEPIMPKARHPASGISWEWLYKIADKGDVKNRQQINEGFNPQQQPKARIAYDEERAAVERGEVEL